MKTVDARKLVCPLPVLELAKAARALSCGEQIELWATDPAAEGDVRAWCDATGFLLLEVSREADVVRLRLEKR